MPYSVSWSDGSRRYKMLCLTPQAVVAVVMEALRNDDTAAASEIRRKVQAWHLGDTLSTRIGPFSIRGHRDDAA